MHLANGKALKNKPQCRINCAVVQKQMTRRQHYEAPLGTIRSLKSIQSLSINTTKERCNTFHRGISSQRLLNIMHGKWTQLFQANESDLVALLRKILVNMFS